MLTHIKQRTPINKNQNCNWTKKSQQPLKKKNPKSTKTRINTKKNATLKYSKLSKPNSNYTSSTDLFSWKKLKIIPTFTILVWPLYISNSHLKLYFPHYLILFSSRNIISCFFFRNAKKSIIVNNKTTYVNTIYFFVTHYLFPLLLNYEEQYSLCTRQIIIIPVG